MVRRGGAREDAEREPRPSAADSKVQRRPPVAPREPPSAPASPPQPPIRAGSRLRVWRSFLLEKPLAEAAPPAAGEEQEKTLCSRLCADISAALCPRATFFRLPASDLGRRKKGAQARLCGGASPRLSEGGGGQCLAHAPPARSKCPSGDRGRRPITSLLGKGAGGSCSCWNLPQAQGSGRKGRPGASWAPSSSPPAPLPLPS